MANQFIYRNLIYSNLGLIDYKQAWDLQYETFAKRLKDETEDTLFLLQHPHTYTLGKVAGKENLLLNDEQLKELGISVHEIDRGGDITYHGPGQIVGYPIIKLSNWKEDTHAYLRALEEVIIKTCDEYGLRSFRNSKYTGVWVGNRKIAAIGVRISRWVTMHGFAFNVNTDLSYFGGIIPCGIKDKDVTSLQSELGKEINLNGVNMKLVSNFEKVFNYSCVREFPEKYFLQTVSQS